MSKRCMGCMEIYGGEFEICPHCGYVEGTKAEEAIHMDPGTLLHDRYMVGRVLGFGGFGVTYIGWDGKLEQKVAIKEYLPSEFSTRMPGQTFVTVFNGEKSEQFRDGMNKFIEEAKHLAKFQNEPGIVRIFDAFAENETAYIIMEFLNGETLTERLKCEKTISENEAVSMLWPVMQSLETVHREGLIHRDIAPDNIFITKSGDVKLIDFGASRYATTSHSRSLTVIIKPGYSPEEQYRSRGDQGPHTDVYALAATLYKMITGKTPPDAMERRAKIESQKRDILEDPTKLNKNISLNRENAILNAMNVQIEDRTPDVQSFMDELNADPPVKRKYGKIKKIDLYSWPLWLKIVIPTVLAALITVGVLLATGVIKFPSLFSDKIVVPDGMVIVPDVEGMDKDAAFETLEKEKLLPSPDGNVESEYVEAGKIVLQTPTSGSYLEENGTVVLTVSSGKGIIAAKDGISTVPYVIWDTQEEAVSKLQQAGLAAPIIETKSNDNVAAGKVISQSKPAGEKLPEGSQITIVVSTGSSAFDMPNVVGQTKETAEKALTSRGLLVSITYEKDDSVSEGKTLKQSIKAGTKVKKGDRVTLTVSSGKSLIKVPSVVGKTETQAKSSLDSSGFDVGVLENYSSDVPKGIVISQNPSAGTNQFKGASVTLVVSKGKQPVNITFNANGGKVSKSNATVYVTQTYGSLPTPSRDYHTFAGWYTAASGGSQVASDTAVINSENHTLYAHWSAKPVSGWVKASEMPANAKVSETKWTYTLREYTENQASSLAGWIKYDTKRTAWGSWSNWSTSNPSNGVRNVESRSVYDHTEYHYYRWVNGGGMYTYKKDNSYWLEEKWFTYQLPTSSKYTAFGYVGSDNVLNWWCKADFADNYSVSREFQRNINRTEWRYQDPIYTNYYYKDSQKEASSDPSGQKDVSNIVKYVKYREK